MERTKVIPVNQNSLGFEVGEEPKWRGEFTLEQVAEFDIKEGKEITVHMLEMPDVFATVEFSEAEKTTVSVAKVPENGGLFSAEATEEEETEVSKLPNTLPD